MLFNYECLILNWSCRDSMKYSESESTQFTLRTVTSAYSRTVELPGMGNPAPGLDINPGAHYGRHCGRYLKILSIFVIASSNISTDKDI